MCGIFVSYNFETKPESIEKLLKKRGPDDFNYQDFGPLRMYHSRLSITGSVGKQPFFVNKQNKKFSYVVNGEFYDYQKIRKSFDYKFKSDTDSELLSPLYLKHNLNDKCLSLLNGEFAFVIYDIYENVLYLVRDRYGVKPLFYSIINDKVIIASESKMLLPFMDAGFDNEVLQTVLTMQYHNNKDSLFNSIKQVPPGSVVKIELNTFKIKTREYFNCEQSDIIENKSKGDVLDSLTNAVKRRTKTDLPLAYTLSGGIDSSSILSLGDKPKGSKAFTVSFKDSGDFDELALATEMADYAGIELESIVVDEQMLIDNLEEAITASESVSINSHVAAKNLMFKEISKQGFKIALSGEGADEIFLGYSHFLMDKDYSTDSYADMRGMHLPHGESIPDEFLKEFLIDTPSFLKAKLSMGNKMHKFLNDDFKIGYELSVLKQIKSLNLKNKIGVSASSEIWSKMCFSNYILNTLSDRLEMAHSLEGRVPFLDRDLIDLALNLPESSKLNTYGTKHILRESVRSLLPESIYKKKKHPFVSPSLIEWSKSDLFFDYLFDIVNSSDFKSLPAFNSHKIIETLDKFKKNDSDRKGYDNVFMLILSVYFLQKNLIKGKKL